ncbi:hypothetical protein AOLI_G00042950 [Acnodon oligacanthus]
MDATQQIDDSFCEDDTGEEKEPGGEEKEREPLAALKVFKNNYIPETEVPLYQGENVLGRDPASCSFPLQACSISSRHAVISVSFFRDNSRHLSGGDTMEALLWDLGSLNGTRKGRFKLTPHVRYALTEGDSVVLADLPCQYISLKHAERNSHAATAKEKGKGKDPSPAKSASEGGMGRGVENGGKRSVLPPVPLWKDKEANLQSPQKTPKEPQRTLVPESDSDSEGEKGGQRERKRFLDSASSDLSSPTCSTLLTPANKVIPESEDESLITPSSAGMGRFKKKQNHSEASSDSFTPALLNFNVDSDTDGEEEDAEVRKTEPEVKPANPPQRDSVDPPCVHMDSDTDVEDEGTDKTKIPEISTVVAEKDLVAPAGRTMDSDTDVEDEGTDKTKSPETAAGVAQKHMVTPAGHAMDSDTDVEENEPHRTETSLPSGNEEQKASLEFHMDSETDVEDEDVPIMIKPASPVSIPTAGPVAEFHMDSDTDAEEEEKPTEAIKLISDSDTDDDDPFKPTKGKTIKNVKALQAKTVQTDSNSDTDMEDDFTAANSKAHKDTGIAPDADCESPVQVQPPAEKVQGEFRIDSDTDVEEEEEKLEREWKGSGTAAKAIQSSTPRGAGLSEEEMETQVFVSPSQPFKRPALPSLLRSSVSPGGRSQDSDDFTVAETQSFVSDALAANATLDKTQQLLRGCGASPFQLGLSDSSHQQLDTEEHTGALDPSEDDWTLQPTQPYATKNLQGRRGSTEAGPRQLDLEATQAYGVDMDNEEEHTQPLKKGNDDSDTNDTGEKRGRVVDDDGEVLDSHPSTADTLILVRSPKLEEQTQAYALFTAQTLPFGEEEEEEEFSGGPGPSGRLCKQRQIDEEQTQPIEPGVKIHVAIAETLPMFEEEEAQEEEHSTESMSSRRSHRGGKAEETQPLEPDAGTHVAIVETQPMCEDEEEHEEERSEITSNRSRRGRKVAKVKETQPLEPNAGTNVAIAVRQLVGEDKKGGQSETTLDSKPRRGKKVAKAEPTQPLELDANTDVAIAETQPLAGEEEEPEEEQSKITSSRRSRRGRKAAKIEETQPLDPDSSTHVAIAVTQPVGEEKEEGRSETTLNSKPRRGTKVAKAEPTQPLELNANTDVAIAETQSAADDEEEGEDKQQRDITSSRRSRRGRKVAKADETRPLEPDVGTRVAKDEALGEDEGAQEEDQQGGPRRPRRRRKTAKAEPTQPPKSDARTTTTETTMDEEGGAQEEEQQASKRSLRGKGRGVSGKGRGRPTAEKEGKMKRGRAVSEEEEDSEEETDGGRKGGRKSTRQKSKEQEERDKMEVEEKGKETQEERREEREQKDQGERNRLERERVECEERELAERLEQERKEYEERERLKKQEEERERKEKEEKERREIERREEEAREKLEKDRKEREERERIEKEEKDRLEREKKEREEKERLEKNKREREELEQRLEKERSEQEEKDTERERRELEEKEPAENEVREKEEREQVEKEKKKKGREYKDGAEKERGRLQGKRRAGLVRKEKGKEDEEVEGIDGQSENSKRRMLEMETAETEKQEHEDGKGKKKVQEKAETEAKRGRGRRPTRKSAAPPAALEESVSVDVPAKRTRSRSNSSNSVGSEQSTSTMDDQTRGQGQGQGQGRGRGRKPAEGVVDNCRPSGRGKTATAVSTETERDSGARVDSCSNSRSSERSSSSAGIKTKDKGEKGSKSVKMEKQEKGQQGSAAAGRGRGRGGKRVEAGDVKVTTTEKAHPKKEISEAMSVNEDSVISQTPSRGRKRGADTSVLAAETPQPTPKTPRRSVAGPTHKVLFTGVVDEDGEKVLLRLGGGLAKGVGDMSHLVTDKVRRTVKFLCAVARGVPIVTPDWLTKCGKAGTFLSPNEFLVKDAEQEKKFNFKLQDSLRAASHQPLLQGYEIHVTPSVKPEPVQMKDIIACCGARYLPKMPTAQKAQLVVVSCEEDRALCNKALGLGVPVVSAEFLLTGILQQKVDLKMHALSPSPSAASRPATQARRK